MGSINGAGGRVGTDGFGAAKLKADVRSPVTERRQALIDLIASGIRNGEISGKIDPELATTALLGAIFYRRLMTGRALDPERASELVTLVLG